MNDKQKERLRRMRDEVYAISASPNYKVVASKLLKQIDKYSGRRFHPWLVERQLNKFETSIREMYEKHKGDSS